MRIYEEDFTELDWIDVVVIEFQEGEGICVPTPNKNGKHWVYWDCTLLMRNKTMPLDLYKGLNSLRFHQNYSMDNDMKLAAKYVRTRNLN